MPSIIYKAFLSTKTHVTHYATIFENANYDPKHLNYDH